jgi:hypothetical protein
MSFLRFTAASAVMVLVSPFVTSEAAAQQYFVSPAGNDAADGLTPATAWQTLDKVNGTTFDPGAEVLLARGGEWHERLVASTSGAEGAPITYGAYGSGNKPRIWGSDVLDRTAFTPVPGTTSTYQLSTPTTVNAFLADHNFFRSSAKLAPGSPLAYTNANAGTWHYEQGKLYVNTGGVAPAQDGRLYTAAVREAPVDSNGKSNLVFRDLIVDESASYNGGYAFRIQDSDNVTLENAEAYRAGKHHFGVINSNNFVGKGLYSAVALPDQGLGGATAYVAYSGAGRTHDNSKWIDVVAENMNGPYPAFYTHGEGVGDILIKNMTARNTGLAIATEGTNQTVRIEGGLIENGMTTLYGDHVTMDGVHITGPDSTISIQGDDNVLQNLLMTGARPATGFFTAIADAGVDNTVQFNTIVLDPSSPSYSTALAILKDTTNTTVRGNIFSSQSALRQWANGMPLIESDFNLFSPDSRILLGYGAGITLEQWMSIGYDNHSLAALAGFVDPTTGNYTLGAGSAAIDAMLPGWWSSGLTEYDFFGKNRPLGGAYDLGAFEAVPEPSTAALVLAGLLATQARRRVRKSH